MGCGVECDDSEDAWEAPLAERPLHEPAPEEPAPWGEG